MQIKNFNQFVHRAISMTKTIQSFTIEVKKKKKVI